jgi:hypothetical protein
MKICFDKSQFYDFYQSPQHTLNRVGAGATRTSFRRTDAVHRPCPLGVRGESERPEGFWFFLPSKRTIFFFLLKIITNKDFKICFDKSQLSNFH